MREAFNRYKQQHAHRLRIAKRSGLLSKASSLSQSIGSLGLGNGSDLELAIQRSGSSFTSDDLEIAFLIAVNQLQLRASFMGANAVYGMHWDVDFDSNSNFLNFIGTAYGTAMVV
jgi:hypothetical protein